MTTLTTVGCEFVRRGREYLRECGPEALAAFDRLLVDHPHVFGSPPSELLVADRERRAHELAVADNNAREAKMRREHELELDRGWSERTRVLAEVVAPALVPVAQALAARVEKFDKTDTERLDALKSIVRREAWPPEAYETFEAEAPKEASIWEQVDYWTRVAASAVPERTMSTAMANELFAALEASLVAQGTDWGPAALRLHTAVDAVRAWRDAHLVKEVRAESPAPTEAPKPTVVTPPAFTAADVERVAEHLSGPQRSAVWYHVTHRGPAPKGVTESKLHGAGIVEGDRLTPYGRAVARYLWSNGGPSEKAKNLHGPFPDPLFGDGDA